MTTSIESDPKWKPVFPARLRKRDPLLAAEDTNPLFYAFQVLRREHKRSRWELLAFFGRSYLWSAVILVLIILPIFLFRQYGELIIIIFLMLYSLFETIRKKWLPKIQEPDPIRSMPREIQFLVTPDGIKREPGLDLWMCGISGRDVAEAIYLESRESGKWVSLGMVLTMWALLGGGFILASAAQNGTIWYKPTSLLSLHGLIFFTSLVWCSWEVFRWGHNYFMVAEAFHSVRFRRIGWQRMTRIKGFWKHQWDESKYKAKQLVTASFVFLGSFLIICTIIKFLTWTDNLDDLRSLPVWKDYLCDHQLSFLISIVLLEFATMFRLWTWIASRKVLAAVAPEIERAGGVFDLGLAIAAEPSDDVIRWWREYRQQSIRQTASTDEQEAAAAR